MSTPRTDAVFGREDSSRAKLARALETELAAMTAQRNALLAALKASQKWLAKVMADKPENDETGIAARCNRQYDLNHSAIARAEEAP